MPSRYLPSHLIIITLAFTGLLFVCSDQLLYAFNAIRSLPKIVRMLALELTVLFFHTLFHRQIWLAFILFIHQIGRKSVVPVTETYFTLRKYSHGL